MIDTLLPGDYFLSNAWQYRTADPQRGELVVFRFPPDESIKYVKRVVGLPGDNVEISGGVVSVNRKPLSEPYVNPANNRRRPEPMTVTVPEGQYFVLGDNRDQSNDSRYWGFVPHRNVIGGVGVIWMSFDSEGDIRMDRIGSTPK